MSTALPARIRRVADELEAGRQVVTVQAVFERISPTISALEREALLYAGLFSTIRNELNRPKRRSRKAVQAEASL